VPEGTCESRRASKREGAYVYVCVCVCVCVCVFVCVCVGEKGEKNWFQLFFQQKLPCPSSIVFFSFSRSLSLTNLLFLLSLFYYLSHTFSESVSFSVGVAVSMSFTPFLTLFTR